MGSSLQWKRKNYSGARRVFRVKPQASSVSLCDGPAYGEPEPEPFRLGADERLEHIFHHLSRKSGAVVGNHDFAPFAVSADGHVYDALRGWQMMRRIDRVYNHVKHDLLELGRIGENRNRIA
jgi:hypothetical protein